MSEQDKKATPAGEETENEYVDYANPEVVERELRKAFAEYEWPNCSSNQPKDRRWKRNKKGSLRKKMVKVTDRPTMMFNVDRVLKILGMAARAMPIKQCANIVGIEARTLYGWLKRGEEEGAGPYYVFMRAFTQLSAAYEANLLGVVHRFTFRGGRVPSEAEARMAANQLERRFPERYRASFDITSKGKQIKGGEGGAPTTIALAYYRPGANGEPELVEPPKRADGEKSILEDDGEE